MKQFSTDLRQLDRIDVKKLVPIKPSTSPRNLSWLERVAVRSAVNLGKPVIPQSGLLLEALDIADHPPSMSILPPTSMAVGSSGSSSSKFDLRAPPETRNKKRAMNGSSSLANGG